MSSINKEQYMKKQLNCFLNFLSASHKKWLIFSFIFTFSSLFLIAFIALIISLLPWRDEFEKYSFAQLKCLLLFSGFDVYGAFKAIALLQTAVFFLAFSSMRKRNWFKIMYGLALLSYPIIFCIALIIYEIMKP